MRTVATIFALVVTMAVVASAFAQPDGDPPRGPRRGDEPAPERPDRPGRQPLHVGDLAPEFTLVSLDGKQKTDTASFRGKRPLILFFGSYT